MILVDLRLQLVDESVLAGQLGGSSGRGRISCSYFREGTTRWVGLLYAQASGCWYHWHCPQGLRPSHLIFRRRHSTQALLVEILRGPPARPPFPTIVSSAPTAGVAAWNVWYIVLVFSVSNKKSKRSEAVRQCSADGHIYMSLDSDRQTGRLNSLIGYENARLSTPRLERGSTPNSMDNGPGRPQCETLLLERRSHSRDYKVPATRHMGPSHGSPCSYARTNLVRANNAGPAEPAVILEDPANLTSRLTSCQSPRHARPQICSRTWSAVIKRLVERGRLVECSAWTKD